MQDASPALAPIRPQERIEALDVVRGLALLGIFLMNIEWFNRPLTAMNDGLPQGLTGANWWASRLIYVFVQGKFWTLFSLLFGMGFAVMLGRAEQAGRSFLRPYLRRIAALAGLGIAHHVLLWNGDILFSYALGAVALLILLRGRWKLILGSLLGFAGLALFPKLQSLWAVVAALVGVSLAALFLRWEKRVTLRGRSLPLFSLLLILLGLLLTAAAAAAWVLPQVPREGRVTVTMMASAFLLLGALSARFHQPLEDRARRLALVVYLFPFTLMTVGGAVRYLTPPVATAPGQEARRAVQQAARTKRQEERKAEIAADTRVHSQGTYREAVASRARHFAQHAPEDAGFAVILVGMFLLGAWFIRSGIMTDTGAHLALFRKLAFIALPLGVGLGLAGAAIATSHTPGQERDGFQLASGLLMLGNLPASLGYLGAVVLMLHSSSGLSRIRVLAPAGRMALTNYLTQSLVSSLVFFGYGLGHWGLGRAWQVAFVVGLFALQVAFSHWWLGRFRYGPMEWLWRAVTYWKIPALRIDRTQPLPSPQNALA